MLSMTPMIWLILADDSRMTFIVATTSFMTRPPLAAATALCLATFEASSVCLALWVTVAAISSIDAADCSRFAAAGSVRADRSSAPLAISELECTISSLEAGTRATMPRNGSCIARSSNIGCAVFRSSTQMPEPMTQPQGAKPFMQDSLSTGWMAPERGYW